MNARIPFFDHPFFLGFDHLERELDRVKKNADSYPPHNVEQIGADGLRITLAVAGFQPEDLDVEINQNQLTIRGKQQDSKDSDKLYLHRGIAARQFQRSFVLADGLEVAGAELSSGLLHINMKRVLPEDSVRKIDITQKDSGSGKQEVKKKGKKEGERQ